MDTQILNSTFVKERVETFYGYGNYRGNYWFIGMEEAAGGDFDDINNRINTWAKRDKLDIDDLAEYHQAIGYPELFEKGARLTVPVWRAIIRIILSEQGEINDITREDIRKYQISKLGRRHEETCLLEMFPLPSPNAKVWGFNNIVDLNQLKFLSDRKEYEKHCIENLKRVENISNKIKEYKPRVVVFYSLNLKYVKHWKEIIGSVADNLKKIGYSNKEYFCIGKNDQTVFVIAKFPRAVPSEYYCNIGKEITAKLAEK